MGSHLLSIFKWNTAYILIFGKLFENTNDCGNHTLVLTESFSLTLSFCTNGNSSFFYKCGSNKTKTLAMTIKRIFIKQTILYSLPTFAYHYYKRFHLFFIPELQKINFVQCELYIVLSKVNEMKL